MSELASPQPGSTSHASIRRTLYGVSALLAVCVVAIVGWKVVRMYRAHQFVAELIRRSAGEVRITHRHPEWFNKTIDEWNGGPVFLHGIDTVESVDLVDDDDLSSRLERLSLLPELEALWMARWLTRAPGAAFRN